MKEVALPVIPGDQWSSFAGKCMPSGPSHPLFLFSSLKPFRCFFFTQCLFEACVPPSQLQPLNPFSNLTPSSLLSPSLSPCKILAKSQRKELNTRSACCVRERESDSQSEREREGGRSDEEKKYCMPAREVCRG